MNPLQERARALLGAHCPCPEEQPAAGWNLTFHSTSGYCSVHHLESDFFKWHPPMSYEPWYCKATAGQGKSETIVLLASWSQLFFRAELKALSCREISAYLYASFLKCLLVKTMAVDYVSDQYKQKPTSNKRSVLSILDIPIKHTI